MAKRKVTAKERLLEHCAQIKEHAQELVDLVEAYERYAHHNKVNWGHAGDMAKLERELVEWGFGGGETGSPQS